MSKADDRVLCGEPDYGLLMNGVACLEETFYGLYVDLREQADKMDGSGKPYNTYAVASERDGREHRSVEDLAKVASCSVARLEKLNEGFAGVGVDLAHEMSMFLIPVEDKYKALVVRDAAARYVDIAESVMDAGGGKLEWFFLTRAACTVDEAAKLIVDVNLHGKRDVLEVMRQLDGVDVGANFRVLEEYRDKGGMYRKLYKKGSEADFGEIKRVVEGLGHYERFGSPFVAKADFSDPYINEMVRISVESGTQFFIRFLLGIASP